VQEFKKDMVMPTITKTGGSFEDAQFNFDALFLERLQQEVKFLYPTVTSYYRHLATINADNFYVRLKNTLSTM